MTDLLFDIPEEIKDIVNPNPRMFMQQDGFKVIIEFKKNFDHKKGLVKMLTLFNPSTRFVDRLNESIKEHCIGEIIDISRFTEVDLGMIYITINAPTPDKGLLEIIYKNLFQHQLPLPYKNEYFLLKSMLERRLLIDYNGGDLSYYLIQAWTGDQNTTTV